MFRRCGKWMVVIALVFTIGAHWAFLQTVAWVGMAVSYSQTDTLSAALSKTFDGKNPCRLCKFVKEGKDSEKKAETAFEIKKLDSLVSFQVPQFYFPPLPITVSSFVSEAFSVREAPLTPPPQHA